MQAQINKNMEPPAKKYKKQDGYDIKGKGNKDQFDFNTEMFFCHTRMPTPNMDR